MAQQEINQSTTSNYISIEEERKIEKNTKATIDELRSFHSSHHHSTTSTIQPFQQSTDEKFFNGIDVSNDMKKGQIEQKQQQPQQQQRQFKSRSQKKQHQQQHSTIDPQPYDRHFSQIKQKHRSKQLYQKQQCSIASLHGPDKLVQILVRLECRYDGVTCVFTKKRTDAITNIIYEQIAVVSNISEFPLATNSHHPNITDINYTFNSPQTNNSQNINFRNHNNNNKSNTQNINRLMYASVNTEHRHENMESNLSTMHQQKRFNAQIYTVDVIVRTLEDGISNYENRLSEKIADNILNRRNMDDIPHPLSNLVMCYDVTCVNERQLLMCGSLLTHGICSKYGHNRGLIYSVCSIIIQTICMKTYRCEMSAIEIDMTQQSCRDLLLPNEHSTLDNLEKCPITDLQSLELCLHTIFHRRERQTAKLNTVNYNMKVNDNEDEIITYFPGHLLLLLVITNKDKIDGRKEIIHFWDLGLFPKSIESLCTVKHALSLSQFGNLLVHLLNERKQNEKHLSQHSNFNKIHSNENELKKLKKLMKCSLLGIFLRIILNYPHSYFHQNSSNYRKVRKNFKCQLVATISGLIEYQSETQHTLSSCLKLCKAGNMVSDNSACSFISDNRHVIQQSLPIVNKYFPDYQKESTRAPSSNRDYDEVVELDDLNSISDIDPMEDEFLKQFDEKPQNLIRSMISMYQSNDKQTNNKTSNSKEFQKEEITSPHFEIPPPVKTDTLLINNSSIRKLLSNTQILSKSNILLSSPVNRQHSHSILANHNNNNVNCHQFPPNYYNMKTVTEKNSNYQNHSNILMNEMNELREKLKEENQFPNFQRTKCLKNYSKCQEQFIDKHLANAMAHCQMKSNTPKKIVETSVIRPKLPDFNMHHLHNRIKGMLTDNETTQVHLRQRPTTSKMWNVNKLDDHQNRISRYVSPTRYTFYTQPSDTKPKKIKNNCNYNVQTNGSSYSHDVNTIYDGSQYNSLGRFQRPITAKNNSNFSSEFIDNIEGSHCRYSGDTGKSSESDNVEIPGRIFNQNSSGYNSTRYSLASSEGSETSSSVNVSKTSFNKS
ncbi:hypothetical protein SNEBB_005435 [Seison nebaliae]|nr:hypothetical protein SNEBB_005435 [Seison nebaliae]